MGKCKILPSQVPLVPRKEACGFPFIFKMRSLGQKDLWNEMSLMHYGAGNICNKEIKIQKFVWVVYWPDRIWGKVTRKEGIASGSTACLMKMFETVFGRWCPSGQGPVGCLWLPKMVLSTICQHLPHEMPQPILPEWVHCSFIKAHRVNKYLQVPIRNERSVEEINESYSLL